MNCGIVFPATIVACFACACVIVCNKNKQIFPNKALFVVQKAPCFKTIIGSWVEIDMRSHARHLQKVYRDK